MWRTMYVGLVGDADSHRARLEAMMGERVAFERRPRTVDELDSLKDRITADRIDLAEAGFELLMLSTDQRRGVVEVELVAKAGSAAAKDCFAERYGDAVAVRWRGPRRHREVPHPFGSWTSEHRRIRVFFGLDRNGQRRGSARVKEETRERIVIELTCLQPLGAVTLVGGFAPNQVDLELREPVGGRVVIDASSGAVRPSLAQLAGR